MSKRDMKGNEGKDPLTLKWCQLPDNIKRSYDWVDLEPGETMAGWWEAYKEACKEEER